MMLVERVLPIALKRLNTIQAGASLTDAAKLLCDTHKALLVVCDPDGVMVGVITKTDIVRQIADCEGSRCTAAAETVMTRDVTYCHPNDSLHTAASAEPPATQKCQFSAALPHIRLSFRREIGTICNNYELQYFA